MKNILYGTTALMAVGLIVGPASAADKIKLSLGGYYTAQAQFGSNENDVAGNNDGFRDHGFGSEGEIYFRGSTTLDNGIRMGVAVDLEAETTGDQIDNNYIWASGNFGLIQYGETWGPGLGMAYGGVGEHNRTGDFASHNPAQDLNGLGFNSFGGGAGVTNLPQQKLAYYTPRMSGFQVGISYAPDSRVAASNGAQNSDQDGNVGSEMLDLGINYTGKVAGTALALHAGYFTSQSEGGAPVVAAAQTTSTTQTAGGDAIITAAVVAAAAAAPAADVDGHSISGQVSSSGVTVGGRYTKKHDQGGAGLDQTQWRVGADYKTGMWGVGVTYQVAEADVTATTEDTSTYLSIGSTYNLGPGITMYGGMVFVSYDDATGAAASEGDNSFAILGSRLAF